MLDVVSYHSAMPSKPAKTTSASIDDPARRRLPILLRRAWYGLNQTFRRRIAHTGVTPDQFTALRTLTEGGAEGLIQSVLTRRMASDPNTIASLVERLHRAGWIVRRPHERDRRAHRLLLTPAGRKKYQQVRRLAVQLQTEVLSVLPPPRREEFLEALGQIGDFCAETK